MHMFRWILTRFLTHFHALQLVNKNLNDIDFLHARQSPSLQCVPELRISIAAEFFSFELFASIIQNIQRFRWAVYCVYRTIFIEAKFNDSSMMPGSLHGLQFWISSNLQNHDVTSAQNRSTFEPILGIHFRIHIFGKHIMTLFSSARSIIRNSPLMPSSKHLFRPRQEQNDLQMRLKFKLWTHLHQSLSFNYF